MTASKNKPTMLAIGVDPWYLANIKKWFEPIFCGTVFITGSYREAEIITRTNHIDIFLLDGFGKEMSMVLQYKFEKAMVCLLTENEYMTCTDPRVHCIQKPTQKKTFIACVMNKWKQQVNDQARSVLIKHHLELAEVYKIDPQAVEVLYMRLKRNFFATFEAVALRHEEHRHRTNFCITLQRGCPGGCLMCGTARIKDHTTTLTSHEIASQIAHLLTSYTAFGCEDGKIAIAAHGGGDPRFCLDEYCNAVRIIEHTYGLNARYIATSIGGEKTWKGMFSRLEKYDMSFEISAISTDKQKRDFVLPATRNDLPLAGQIEMLADNASKHGRLYKYRHLLTVGFNDSASEAKEIAKLVIGTPHRVIIQKMEAGCLAQFPKEVSDQDVNRFMHMLKEEGADVCYNKNIGEGPVKCGMHIAPQDRRIFLKAE